MRVKESEVKEEERRIWGSEKQKDREVSGVKKTKGRILYPSGDNYQQF